MKWVVFQFLFAVTVLSASVWADDGKLTSLIPAPVLVNNIDLRTWPASVALGDAFDIFRTMMQPDPETLQILQKSEEKLSAHEISDIHSILSYCPDDGSLGDAYFSQTVKIIGTRITIPGTTPNAWPSSSLEAAQKSFSSKTVQTPFIEILLAANQPGICLKKSDNLLFSYDSFVHELLHFLLKDPYKEMEDGIISSAPPDLLNTMVLQEGGELDAYKAGLSAEIRFMKRSHISLKLSSYRFFDSSGNLTDPSGFKDSILKTYTPYYDDPANLDGFIKSRLNLIDWQIQILQTTVQPFINAGNNSENQSKFSAELARLQAQRELLIKKNPAP